MPEVFACGACHDIGRVASGRLEVRCSRCASWSEEDRERAYAAATARAGDRPAISVPDLSRDERELLIAWTIEFPKANRLTLLGWIEGRRYDPASDPVCVAETAKKLAAWRFARCGAEGPLPAWAEAALRGEDPPMNDAEREWIEGLRAERLSSRRRAA